MNELQIKLNGWPYKLESSFTSAWLKILKEKWYYVDKVSDGSIWVKRIDCYIRTNKTTYCCEIKVVNKDIFPLDHLRPNQFKALRLWESLGWTAIVVVYSKELNDYKIIPFDVIKYIDKKDSVKLDFNR